MNRMKRLLTFLLLVCGMATGSWALTQDTDGYYLIGSAQDWQDFATGINNGTIATTANARLTADNITASSMIGTNSRRYAGTFDGQGYTIVANITGTSGYEAPFAYIQNATIKKLTVSGTVNGGIHCSSLVSLAYGTNTISNIIITATVTTTGSHCGGIVGHGNNSTTTLSDCLFSGTINGRSGGSRVGVIWGWSGGATVNVYRCLENGSYTNCSPFNPIGDGYDAINTSASYYINARTGGGVYGLQATDELLQSGEVAFQLQHARTDLVWGQTIGTENIPVMTTIESKRVYRAEGGGYTNNPILAAADQSIPPFTYTESNGSITITGFELDFTPPANYALVIPDEIGGKPVVAIGNQAFFEKTNFISLYVGKNVKTIGNDAFRRATAMKSVTFAADGVIETLGESAFRECAELTEFTMPNTVKTVGAMVLQANAKLASVTLSNQLTTLASQALCNTPLLASIEIPSSVKSIEASAFWQCTGLTSITIPSSVTSMGTGVFQECTSLKSITFEATCHLTSIPNNTFTGCTLLNGVTIPSSVASIGSSAFENCTGLTAIEFPSSVKTINSSAFKNTGLTSVTIPATVTSMGDDCFRESAVQTVSIACPTLGTRAFYGCTSLEAVTIANTVTNLKESSFQGCTQLSNTSIPSSVTTIGNSVFNGCILLTAMTIPSSVTTMGTGVFQVCTNLTSATFADGFHMAQLPQNTFYGCTSLNGINIPSSITAIGNNAFRGCTSLSTITIPANVTTMGTYVFYGCNLLTTATFADGCQLTQIPQYTFWGCTKLSSVNIPSTVTTIGNYAFSSCSNLTAITIPANVTSIDSYAFNQCTTLNNVTIPSSVKTINSWAFGNCTNLANLTIEEGLTTLAGDVFQYSGLTSVTLPTTVTSIGNNLFYRCDNLATLDLSKADKVGSLYALTTINRNATGIFNGIPADCEVILPYGCRATGDHVSIAEPDENSIGIADDGYYELSKPEHWKVFSAITQTVPTANARMTADIDLGNDQTHIGSITQEQGPFYSGTFDGQGHTLTIAYDNRSSNIIIAPFTQIRNATIKNLKVAGSIYSTFAFIGVVGYVNGGGTSYISNVWSTASFTCVHSGWKHTSGIVGSVGNNATANISDCLVTGSVSASDHSGPFVGLIYNGTAYISNCLSTGTLNVSSYTTETTTNSYVKGYSAEVTDANLSDGTTAVALQNSREETVWVQDPLTNQPMLALFAGKYTVPASGLGTFSAKAKFTLPDGLDAYYCKDYAAGKISVVAIDGVVPAETGVLLKGTPGETYTLTGTNEAPADITDNALVAVTEATHVDQTSDGYTNFMMSGGKFVKIADSSDPDVKMPANRAYLRLNLGAGSNEYESLALVWDDDPTGIAPLLSPQGGTSHSPMGETEGAWYDLSGRKVKNPTKGIYIQKGKKVLVK